MASFPVQALTVYAADDTTPLFTVSTDPAHAQPYLKPFSSYPEQEIDFVRGSASIGGMSVEIVDVPTDPTDQTTGYLTGQLADANGYSQVNGHRVLVTEDRGAGAETVLDGVVRSVVLLDTFVTYALELRDIRERERKTKAFETTDTPTILPRGVLNGYGVSINGRKYPIPATSPLTGFYRADGANRGEIEFGFGAQLAELKLTEPMREAFENISPLEDEPETLIYDRWKLLWRDKATGGAYTEVTQVAHRHASLSGGGGRLPYSVGGGYIGGLRINNLVSSDTLPSNGQEIEVIVQYDGPVTEEWPYHLEGLTVGELLRNAYRGDHSDEDPRIRYDESALLALTTPVRGIIKKPVDDLRSWAEKHAYPISHSVPTLNASGEIGPITYLLPDSTVTPVSLTDSNCRPAGGGWSHGAEDAVNLVTCDYQRDFRVSPEIGADVALSDQIRSVTQPVRVRHQASIDLLGEQPLEISSELLRAIGTSDGGPLSGDQTDETGARIAVRVGRMALDRFPLGGQYFRLDISRDDSDAEGLREGDWVTVGVSWMPDYLSGERGASRLAQVVSRMNLNAAWGALTLIDAGSAAAPLGQPTLGTVTADAAGVVSVPVTALASGDPDARVEYAVNATEPSANSELWTFLDRVGSVPTTLTTPPLPAGGTAWVRTRSEDVGRRPSTYTTPVSVAIPQTPRVFDVGIEIDADGVPTISWSPNQYCLGVRVGYEVHALDTVPSYADTVDVEASDGETTLADVRLSGDLVLSVEVEPYPTWTGSAVSGTAGPVVQVSSGESVALDLSVSVVKVKSVPAVDPVTPNTFYLELAYNVGPDVYELEVYEEATFVTTGFETFTYTFDRDGSTSFGTLAASGRHRLRSSGGADMEWLDTDEGLLVRLTPKTADGVEGVPVVVDIGDLADLGELQRVELSAGGTVVADYVVPGSNVTIDTDANGRPRINASSGGGASQLSDLSDVGTASPTSRNVLVGDGTDFDARALEGADIQSGVLAVARVPDHDALNGFVAAEHIDWSVTGPEDVQVDRVPNLPASRVTTGTFANARIAQSNVTQHQAALSIGAGQLVPGTFGGAADYTFPAGVNAVGDVVSNTSDARLKDVIGRVRWALPKLFLLRAIYYRWNELGAGVSEGLDPTEERVGLFAQDVMRICPQAIRLSPAGGGYLAFQPEMLLPFVVRAIQELTVLVVVGLGVLLTLAVL